MSRGPDRPLSRRTFLRGGALAATGGLAFAAAADDKEAAVEAVKPDVPAPDYRIERGRVRHSVMGWCFNPMPTEELIAACHRMGMTAMEGIDEKHYPKLRDLGMKPSLVGSHGFRDGPASRADGADCSRSATR